MSKQIKSAGDKKDERYPLPEYPAKDDIYRREDESEIDPETRMAKKGEEEDPSLDEGLDIPGSDLDDEDELIGEEDEENNYYSLGGDNHEDLEEDAGE